MNNLPPKIYRFEVRLPAGQTLPKETIEILGKELEASVSKHVQQQHTIAKFKAHAKLQTSLTASSTILPTTNDINHYQQQHNCSREEASKALQQGNP